MVSEKMKPFMANNSAIRAMFEAGKRMALEVRAPLFVSSLLMVWREKKL